MNLSVPIIAGASPTSTGDCQEGYYCRLGSFTPTPTDGFTGEECPEGHYCVRGTPAPESCPPGTFSNALGLRSIHECTNCTPGLFCNGTALTAPSGDCWPRYYCSGRAEHPAPQDGITGGNCTPGHFCPGKTPNPIPCVVSKEDDFNRPFHGSLFKRGGGCQTQITVNAWEKLRIYCLTTQRNLEF